MTRCTQIATLMLLVFLTDLFGFCSFFGLKSLVILYL
ncbi:unnamed protein product, partial [Brassica oleracea]